MIGKQIPPGERDLVEILEKEVDQTNLFHVLTALELLCHEKADHLVINWQDRVSANRWRDAGRVIYKILAKIEALEV